jgi:hypothetical protein
MTTIYDERTGRPMDGAAEALETLSDQELESELTIASLHQEAPREQRWERLWTELLNRRLRYRKRGLGAT